MKTTKTLETALELVSGTRAVQNGDKLINHDNNEDDFIDICGYGAIAGELKEEIKKLGDTLGENNSAKG